MYLSIKDDNDEKDEMMEAGKIEDYDIEKLANMDNIIHQKIQLWTNDDGNEYALRLLLDGDINSDKQEFIASTNPNEKYIYPVAESDDIEDLRHGWDYTLRELIENYKEKLYQQNFRDDKHLYRIKLISFHKCTYCNKKFANEEEKKEHEFIWHI